MEGTSTGICLSSKKKQKISNTDAVDRLSELPETLLQQILSSLDTKQAVHTSLLSRTWRYTWRSISNLTLDQSQWMRTKYMYLKAYNSDFQRLAILPKSRYANFVDHVLGRINNCNVKNLHMNCGSYCDKNKINEWICCAVRKLNVKEIYLEIRSCENSHTLPKFLFTSAISKFVLHGSKVYSKLEDCWDIQAPRDGRARLPKSMCLASQLRTLELISAILPEGNSERKLILRCPVLENLMINNCGHHDLKVVNICAPELKTLDIRNDCLGLFSCCAIHICTPNLETLSLKGYLYKDYQVEKLSSLVSADIVISGHTDAKGSPSLKHLINILKGIYSVRTLHLHNQRFQLANSHHTLERLPPEFSNLRCLKMTWSGNSCVQVITNILRSAHMETLVLEVIKACFDKKSFDDESLFQTMFCHLKYIVIEKLLGTPNELRILRCLLKNATVLEKLTITELISANKEKAERIRKLLTSFPTASSNVKTQFLEERDGADFST